MEARIYRRGMVLMRTCQVLSELNAGSVRGQGDVPWAGGRFFNPSIGPHENNRKYGGQRENVNDHCTSY